MAVFTPLTPSQVQQLLATQTLSLQEFTPASEGIENSNFFVSALDARGESRRYVLTLLESLTLEQAGWFQRLLTRLGEERLPVPLPIGELQQYQGKPVLLAPCFEGEHVEQPSVTQAAAIGQLLARLHQSGFHELLPPGVESERQRLARLSDLCPQLPAPWDERALRLLADWQQVEGDSCLIHGDLFRDNALFEGERLSGVLDFYNACHELPAYDLAVVLNDWALDENAQPRPELHAAVLAGYGHETELPTPELLPLALAVAALRFWLSRLASQKLSAHAGNASKPTEEFAAKLALRWQQLEGVSRR